MSKPKRSFPAHSSDLYHFLRITQQSSVNLLSILSCNTFVIIKEYGSIYRHSLFQKILTAKARWSVAKPKSPIFTWSSESKKMLTGFKSRWIIPWQKRAKKQSVSQSIVYSYTCFLIWKANLVRSEVNRIFASWNIILLIFKNNHLKM